MESFNLQKTLVDDLDRPLPDNFHARLGLKLPLKKSKVYEQLEKIEEYAEANQMRLNSRKSKFMIFNPTEKYDFEPRYEVDGKDIETVDQMKLLGLIVSNDLKWRANTDNMTQKAYSRMWMVKRLKMRGASLSDLTDVYIKQIRSILEFGVPVWNPALTVSEICDIERVQKSFLHIMFGNDYICYELALNRASLNTLEIRRVKNFLTFPIRSAKHPKHQEWFVSSDPSAPDTRSAKVQYKKPLCRLTRFKNSPIPYLTNLLNNK